MAPRRVLEKKFRVSYESSGGWRKCSLTKRSYLIQEFLGLWDLDVQLQVQCSTQARTTTQASTARTHTHNAGYGLELHGN
eukprot:54704-Rhodomonas_salina.3